MVRLVVYLIGLILYGMLYAVIFAILLFPYALCAAVWLILFGTKLAFFLICFAFQMIVVLINMYIYLVDSINYKDYLRRNHVTSSENEYGRDFAREFILRGKREKPIHEYRWHQPIKVKQYKFTLPRVSMPNPVSIDSTGDVSVRSYIRRQNGKLVFVRAHTRSSRR